MASRTRFATTAYAPEQVTLCGHFAVGAAGAVSTTATLAQGLNPGEKLTGAAVTKTAATDGRYTITFSVPFAQMPSVSCNIQGPATAAFPTATGSDPQVRGTTAELFYVQCKRPDTQADLDAASGSVIHWTATGWL